MQWKSGPTRVWAGSTRHDEVTGPVRLVDRCDRCLSDLDSRAADVRTSVHLTRQRARHVGNRGDRSLVAVPYHVGGQSTDTERLGATATADLLETIAQMMTNQLPDGQWIRFALMGEQPGKVFGLAGGIIQTPSKFDHSDASGELYWGGVAGTQWWISPKHIMAGVMMAQRQMAFVHPFSFEFKRLAYEAVKQKEGLRATA